MDREALEIARDIAIKSRVTYDTVHVAMVMRNNIATIITKCLWDWLRIQNSWAGWLRNIGSTWECLSFWFQVQISKSAKS